MVDRLSARLSFSTTGIRFAETVIVPGPMSPMHAVPREVVQGPAGTAPQQSDYFEQAKERARDSA